MGEYIGPPGVGVTGRPSVICSGASVRRAMAVWGTLSREASHGSAVEAASLPQARDKLTHSIKKNHKGEKWSLQTGFNISCSLAFYTERFEASTRQTFLLLYILGFPPIFGE